MNEFLSRLNSTERRFLVGVVVVFFLVVNVFWVWPHFKDWSNTKTRMAGARTRLRLYSAATNQIPKLEAQVKNLASEGLNVPPEDQAFQLVRIIQNQATRDGVGIVNMGAARQLPGTNQFFMDQIETINVIATETQLVQFLYHLGADNSLVRVRDLSVQPDPPHQHLNAHITLVASYQKNPVRAPAKAAVAPKPAERPAPKAGPRTFPQPRPAPSRALPPARK